MRKLLIGIVGAVLFVGIINTHVSADYRRDMSISIRVECVADAADVIRALPGSGLREDVHFHAGGGSGNFARRVNRAEFATVQEALREIGDVMNESEHISHMESELLEINVMLNTNAQEQQRLTALMATADSLDIVIAMERRLSEVANERDWLQGRANFIAAAVENPIINITVWENPPPSPRPEPTNFGERTIDSFLRSWNGFVGFLQGTAVFFAYVSVPLAIIGPFWVAAFVMIRKKRKKIIEGKREGLKS